MGRQRRAAKKALPGSSEGSHSGAGTAGTNAAAAWPDVEHLADVTGVSSTFGSPFGAAPAPADVFSSARETDSTPVEDDAHASLDQQIVDEHEPMGGFDHLAATGADTFPAEQPQRRPKAALLQPESRNLKPGDGGGGVSLSHEPNQVEAIGHDDDSEEEGRQWVRSAGSSSGSRDVEYNNQHVGRMSDPRDVLDLLNHDLESDESDDSTSASSARSTKSIGANDAAAAAAVGATPAAVTNGFASMADLSSRWSQFEEDGDLLQQMTLEANTAAVMMSLERHMAETEQSQRAENSTWMRKARAVVSSIGEGQEDRAAMETNIEAAAEQPQEQGGGYQQQKEEEEDYYEQQHEHQHEHDKDFEQQHQQEHDDDEDSIGVAEFYEKDAKFNDDDQRHQSKSSNYSKGATVEGGKSSTTMDTLEGIDLDAACMAAARTFAGEAVSAEELQQSQEVQNAFEREEETYYEEDGEEGCDHQDIAYAEEEAYEKDDEEQGGGYHQDITADGQSYYEQEEDIPVGTEFTAPLRDHDRDRESGIMRGSDRESDDARSDGGLVSFHTHYAHGSSADEQTVHTLGSKSAMTYGWGQYCGISVGGSSSAGPKGFLGGVGGVSGNERGGNAWDESTLGADTIRSEFLDDTEKDTDYINGADDGADFKEPVLERRSTMPTSNINEFQKGDGRGRIDYSCDRDEQKQWDFEEEGGLSQGEPKDADVGVGCEHHEAVDDISEDSLPQQSRLSDNEEGEVESSTESESSISENDDGASSRARYSCLYEEESKLSNELPPNKEVQHSSDEAIATNGGNQGDDEEDVTDQGSFSNSIQSVRRKQMLHDLLSSGARCEDQMHASSSAEKGRKSSLFGRPYGEKRGFVGSRDETSPSTSLTHISKKDALLQNLLSFPDEAAVCDRADRDIDQGASPAERSEASESDLRTNCEDKDAREDRHSALVERKADFLSPPPPPSELSVGGETSEGSHAADVSGVGLLDRKSHFLETLPPPSELSAACDSEDNRTADISGVGLLERKAHLLSPPPPPTELGVGGETSEGSHAADVSGVGLLDRKSRFLETLPPPSELSAACDSEDNRTADISGVGLLERKAHLLSPPPPPSELSTGGEASDGNHIADISGVGLLDRKSRFLETLPPPSELSAGGKSEGNHTADISGVGLLERKSLFLETLPPPSELSAGGETSEGNHTADISGVGLLDRKAPFLETLPPPSELSAGGETSEGNHTADISGVGLLDRKAHLLSPPPPPSELSAGGETSEGSHAADISGVGLLDRKSRFLETLPPPLEASQSTQDEGLENSNLRKSGQTDAADGESIGRRYCFDEEIENRSGGEGEDYIPISSIFKHKNEMLSPIEVEQSEISSSHNEDEVADRVDAVQSCDPVALKRLSTGGIDPPLHKRQATWCMKEVEKRRESDVGSDSDITGSYRCSSSTEREHHVTRDDKEDHAQKSPSSVAASCLTGDNMVSAAIPEEENKAEVGQNLKEGWPEVNERMLARPSVEKQDVDDIEKGWVILCLEAKGQEESASETSASETSASASDKDRMTLSPSDIVKAELGRNETQSNSQELRLYQSLVFPNDGEGAKNELMEAASIDAKSAPGELKRPVRRDILGVEDQSEEKYKCVETTQAYHVEEEDTFQSSFGSINPSELTFRREKNDLHVSDLTTNEEMFHVRADTYTMQKPLEEGQSDLWKSDKDERLGVYGKYPILQESDDDGAQIDTFGWSNRNLIPDKEIEEEGFESPRGRDSVGSSSHTSYGSAQRTAIAATAAAAVAATAAAGIMAVDSAPPTTSPMTPNDDEVDLAEVESLRQGDSDVYIKEESESGREDDFARAEPLRDVVATSTSAGEATFASNGEDDDSAFISESSDESSFETAPRMLNDHMSDYKEGGDYEKPVLERRESHSTTDESKSSNSYDMRSQHTQATQGDRKIVPRADSTYDSDQSLEADAIRLGALGAAGAASAGGMAGAEKEEEVLCAEVAESAVTANAPSASPQAETADKFDPRYDTRYDSASVSSTSSDSAYSAEAYGSRNIAVARQERKTGEISYDDGDGNEMYDKASVDNEEERVPLTGADATVYSAQKIGAEAPEDEEVGLVEDEEVFAKYAYEAQDSDSKLNDDFDDGHHFSYHVYNDGENDKDKGVFKRFFGMRWRRIGLWTLFLVVIATVGAITGTMLPASASDGLLSEVTISEEPSSLGSQPPTPSPTEYVPEAREYLQLGDALQGEGDGDLAGFSVSLSDDGKYAAMGARRNAEGGKKNRGSVRIFKFDDEAWKKVAEIDGESKGDQFGYSCSLSADGKKIAIGVPGADAGGKNSGQVLIYEELYGEWTETAALSGEEKQDLFGLSVSLDSTGEVLAVGAPYDSINDSSYAGAVYVYQANRDATWSSLGFRMDGTSTRQLFGWSVSVTSSASDSDLRVAIGSPRDESRTENSGFVTVYQYNPSLDTWQTIGGEMSRGIALDRMGFSVSLSDNGQRVAIGAIGDSTNGIFSGIACVYEDKEGNEWNEIGCISGNEGEKLGLAVSLSPDGTTVQVGRPKRRDENGKTTGQVNVYHILQSSLHLLADINGESGDNAGFSLSSSKEGKYILSGSPASNRAVAFSS